MLVLHHVDEETGSLLLTDDPVVVSADLPSVRDLWVSSSFPAAKDLLVQWELSAAPPPALPVGHFNVQLRSEAHPSASRWSTVDGSITSTVIQGTAVLLNSAFISLRSEEDCSLTGI